MIGSVLKELLTERGIGVSELSRRVGVPVQTLYSIIRRDNMLIDLDLLLRVCAELSVPIEYFCGGEAVPGLPGPAELGFLTRLRELDAHGQEMVTLVLEKEGARVRAEREAAEAEPAKIIPLYLTPAAAGYASPALGEDYEDYPVPADSMADFAARIAGDSMEPYIHDGDVVLVRRDAPLTDGDVGLFFVDGDMKCKQYCEDILGNIYLFSLNRERADADVTVAADSGVTVLCFGKVLLPRRPALP